MARSEPVRRFLRKVLKMEPLTRVVFVPVPLPPAESIPVNEQPQEQSVPEQPVNPLFEAANKARMDQAQAALMEQAEAFQGTANALALYTSILVGMGFTRQEAFVLIRDYHVVLANAATR